MREASYVIPCLILVAGPAASGKSTFISQLRDGTLPIEIGNLLPADAIHWPEFLRTDLAPLDQASEGAIFHLSITGPSEAYESILETAMRRAALTIVVHIEVSSERLIKNVRRRMVWYREQYLRSGARRCKTAFGRLLWKAAMSLRAPSLASSERQKKLLNTFLSVDGLLKDRRRLYEDPDAVAAIYQKWGSALDRLKEANADLSIREIRVSMGTADERQDWELIGSSSRQLQFR